jgi:signal transduction histidine kinase
MSAKKSDAQAKKNRLVLVGQLMSVTSGLVLLICGFFLQQFVWPEGPPLAGYVLPSLVLLGVAIVLSIWDDAERRKMQEALREFEEKLRRVFEAAADAIIVTDLNGNIIDCNQATLVVGGYSAKGELVGKSSRGHVAERDRQKDWHASKGELINRSVFKFVAKKDRSRALQLLKSIPESGTVRNSEYTLLAKDGHEFIAEVSASVLKDKLGRSVGFVVILKDITVRKEMEKELEDYSEHLEELVEERARQLRQAQEQLLRTEKLAAIGELATMVGHDLRNPLQSMKNAASYLKISSDSKSKGELEEMLEIIEKNIDYSNKIVNDLLDYSKEIRLKLTETNPERMITEAMAFVKPPSNIKVDNLTRKEPKVDVDAEKLERVFVNIIKNAFDAMATGGTLTIKSEEIGDKIEFAFSDTGSGMSKETLQKIWSPLFTTKAKGMGLGLAICKRFVEAHGGTILVESTVGKGSTFKVTFPIKLKADKGSELVFIDQDEHPVVACRCGQD